MECLCRGRLRRPLPPKGGQGKRMKKKKAKQKYPKQMTIRYDAKQEKDIKDLMERTCSNTMSKAFIKAPNIIKEQHRMLDELRDKLQTQAVEIDKLHNIKNAWKEFVDRVGEL
jgi:hypothetical protein